LEGELAFAPIIIEEYEGEEEEETLEAVPEAPRIERQVSNGESTPEE
jgi:hypothetical protein